MGAEISQDRKRILNGWLVAIRSRISKHRHLIILLVIFTFLNLVDVVYTHRNIALGGYELNPLLKSFATSWWLMTKEVMMLLIIGFFVWAAKDWPEKPTGWRKWAGKKKVYLNQMLLWCNAVMMLVCAWQVYAYMVMS